MVQETDLFKPGYMPTGILTAACFELTDRRMRDEDPDQAIIDWIRYASEKLDTKLIQLSAAMHPSEADVPAEAMLDPVANHLDLRAPMTRERADRILAACNEYGVRIADIGYFDNMLHPDLAIRDKKHVFMIKVMDAAALLGVKAVCGFVGRNFDHDMDMNLRDFRESFVPLLQEAKKRDLVYRVENCPMPGWTTCDNSINNIAYCAGMWMLLYNICVEECTEESFRIHYDPSHDILLGKDPSETFRILNESGFADIIGGFHVKGQVMSLEGLAEWGYWGQTANRGDHVNGVASLDSKLQGKAWLKQTAISTHELPGTAEYNPVAALKNKTVDWFGLFRAAYQYLDVDWENMPLIVEHELPEARKGQSSEWLAPLLKGSIRYVNHIAQAAADMHAIQNDVMNHMALKVQTVND